MSSKSSESYDDYQEHSELVYKKFVVVFNIYTLLQVTNNDCITVNNIVYLSKDDANAHRFRKNFARRTNKKAELRSESYKSCI